MNKSRSRASDQPLPGQHPIEALNLSQVRPIRGARFLRVLHRLVPLGRKYHPLLYAVNSRRGFFVIYLINR